MKPSFLRTSQARNYEREKVKTKSIFPYKIDNLNRDSNMEKVMANHLKKNGFINIPLSEYHIRDYADKWLNYVLFLMDLPPGLPLKKLREVLSSSKFSEYNYRYEKLKQSRHVPNHHGKTLYGHYFQENLNLLKDISPVIFSVVTGLFGEQDQNYPLVGTADIDLCL